MTVEDLQSNDWQKSGAKLFEAMFTGSSLSPSAVTELIVVPDGITWYVPFEALVAEEDAQSAPLVSFAKIRQAPTAGLAFSFDGAWRRVQRTGIVAGDILPGEKDEQVRAESVAPLQAARQRTDHARAAASRVVAGRRLAARRADRDGRR